MKKHFQYLLGIACMCAIQSCSVQSKNTNTNINSTSTEGPAPHSKQTIDINSILAEGVIVSEQNKYFFNISKVIKRGRQAPTILANQKLSLKDKELTKIPKDQTITATLRCNNPNETNPIWIIVDVYEINQQ
ncbi:hypothetical protein [Carboxylicivirga linearis]|uniref:Lipoprotein n=1 Tax=Carboxylicivirga linearis TaxID=1628157 RepID=A0ABS5JXX0_9BACT|nr:hypothetical protein [Carboxylicivirga linearis]MBS2099782.1 hypothetical protein [Carboxylicivirga linearis]